MPYEWLPPDGSEQHLHLWPHRSLSQRGFVWFVGATAVLIALPLLGIIGTPVLWVLLPFLLAALWGIWFALRKNGRDRDIVEDLRLSPDRITLVRHGPKGKRQDWDANPYWLRVTLHATGGPVPNYLTLKAEGREVELGAFLSEEERVALKDELLARFLPLRTGQ
ncbi:DUF2244 domain-containing protein [Tabrizicola sp.]|jgi:uncharacterized membrane protein|uniref:DUF2244 domain-containing protein n=1 Tax=Tabrizicola sp. TaxID=2005166 RepID=UPI0025FB56A7|nr:DUF2244 domain-containing protein [Tabrizicola sp.]MBY0351164.1 DUF2244 domain-containing protein [Tabrizicola sp.]MDK2775374.1 DUF2244 domain-containing protein [Tabrizicola sp.]